MKRFNIKIAGLALLASFGLASCSDAFLEEKMNYDQAGPEIYNDYAGALGRLSDIYGLCLPDPNGNPSWQHISSGFADDLSKCTEEFSGYGLFVNPKKELNTVGAPGSQPDYFLGDASNVRNNPWGLIRNINDAIIGIEQSTRLTEEQKEQCLGQLYFFRAWRYFLLVKWYGGVPIIKDCPPIDSSSVTPRSSAKECFNFIVEDLDMAADLLEPYTGKGQWRSGDNYGRVTTAAALALKGRVLTWWCSPLFNRENDVERYKAAYEMMKADYERITAGGYGLYKPNGDSHGLSDWGKMFNVVAGSEEGVFVARFNNLASGTPDYHRNNPIDQKSRPGNTLGGGGITPSAMIIDLFPMADGLPPKGYSTKLESSLDYNPNYPFLHRDMRFYRTFGFPGIYWRFNGDPTDLEKKMNVFKGDNYQLWNYVWYPKADQVSKNTGSDELGADNLMENVKGVYVMKRSTSDKGANHYRYLGVSAGEAGFRYSAQTYFEIRFAEVMLNLAEVACGAGFPAEAVDNYLKPIRKRAGYNTVPDNYHPVTSDIASTYKKANLGIVDAAWTSQDICMAHIMYERQIELAFEGKRFDDMRRWLLFDGGVGFKSGFPAEWELTGWGGNTCDYLGVKPLNGQRRENLVFQVKPTIDAGLGGGVGGKEWAQGKWNESPDLLYLYFKAQADKGKVPIKEAAAAANKTPVEIQSEWAKILEDAGITMEGPAMGIMECFLTSTKSSTTRGAAEDAYWQKFQDWRQGIAADLDTNAKRSEGRTGNKNIDQKLYNLYTKFYQPYIQRKMKYGDGLSDNNTIDETTVVTFLPRYYMLGLTSGAQNRNETLEQTAGWADYFGGEGTFDPLKDENPEQNLPEVKDNPKVEEEPVQPEEGEGK